MSSNYSSSRRSSSRPRGDRRPSSHSSYQGRSTRTSSKPAPKVGFFSKILSLFGLGKTSKKKFSSTKASDPSLKSERSTKRNTSSGERRAPRKPESSEVTTPRLYIGNLSFDTTESDLFELFNGIGQVQNVELVSYRDTHRSKGFGFVQMTTIEEAKRAVSELHDKEYMGRKLVVSGARALPERRAESVNTHAENNKETTTEETHCCMTTSAEKNSIEETCCSTITASKAAPHDSCCHEIPAKESGCCDSKLSA